jgi:AcrR family transcriptional regulator
MTTSEVTAAPAERLRDRQRADTRRELALAAFALAQAHGLANVRVPDIAASVGVSPRTFNNYFSSKEEAIVWPAAQRSAQMAAVLRKLPQDLLLEGALVHVMTTLYELPRQQGLPPQRQQGLPPQWLRQFRVMVGSEPALHGEYLKASSAAEQSLAAAIAERLPQSVDALYAPVIAAMVVGAERAAVLNWMRRTKPDRPLVEVVREAVEFAVDGVSERL